MKNIFDWLDIVRQRPGMWLGDGSLHELEFLISGYYMALENHNISEEEVPQLERHFLNWLLYKKSWSVNCGMARAIETYCKNKKKRKPLDVFFKLVDEFRQLKPTLLRSIELDKKNKPTGKRVIIGYKNRIKPVKKVEVWQYSPEHLYFLKFYSENKTKTDYILMDKNGYPMKSMQNIFNWLHDELQISKEQWEASKFEDIRKMLKQLGYDKKWLDYDFLKQVELRKQYLKYKKARLRSAEYDFHGDQHPEHLRHETILKLMKEKAQFSDKEVAQLFELVELDEDQAMARNALKYLVEMKKVNGSQIKKFCLQSYKTK